MRELVFLFIFLSALSAFSAEEAKSPCPESSLLFKREVHPFLRKHCSGCHGDEGKDFDRLQFMAPPHSVFDPLVSYLKTRGYLNLADPKKSRLVLIGENGHCVDKGGEQGCGAKKGEIASLIANWVNVEKSCESKSNILATTLKAMNSSSGPTTKLLTDMVKKPSTTVNGTPKILTEDDYGEVKQIATGEDHACAVYEDGLLRCWGSNTSYQSDVNVKNVNTILLSLSSNMSNLKPVALGSKVKQVAAGERFTCALLESDEVKCWGNYNSGQLGSVPPRKNTSYYYSRNEPVMLTVNLGKEAKPVFITTGNTHACALMSDGKAKCWGNNANDSLGYGPMRTTSDDGQQIIKDLPFEKKVISISAGNNVTCAVLQGGEVKCWGASAGYIRGYPNSYAFREAAVDKLAPVNLSYKAKQISVINNVACIVTSGDEALCWGDTSQAMTGQEVKENEREDYTSAAFAKLKAIPLGAKVKSIAVGAESVCALLAVGKIKCWGMNAAGELGSGDSRRFIGNSAGDIASLQPVVLEAKATAIAAGFGEFNCAIVEYNEKINGSKKKVHHRAKCWGSNSSGQLGNGDQKARGLLDLGDAELIPRVNLLK